MSVVYLLFPQTQFELMEEKTTSSSKKNHQLFHHWKNNLHRHRHIQTLLHNEFSVSLYRHFRTIDGT